MMIKQLSQMGKQIGAWKERQFPQDHQNIECTLTNPYKERYKCGYQILRIQSHNLSLEFQENSFYEKTHIYISKIISQNSAALHQIKFAKSFWKEQLFHQKEKQQAICIFIKKLIELSTRQQIPIAVQNSNLKNFKKTQQYKGFMKIQTFFSIFFKKYLMVVQNIQNQNKGQKKMKNFTEGLRFAELSCQHLNLQELNRIVDFQFQSLILQKISEISEMDINKQIQQFRSEALMSRYKSAIQSGNKLLEKFRLLQNVFNVDFLRIQKEIQMEVNYCMELNQFIFGDQQKQTKQPIYNKNEQLKTQIFCKTSSSKKWKPQISHEVTNENKILNLNAKEFEKIKTNETIQEKLHRNLILPLNMPLFKLKSSIFLIITNNCLREILQYLLHYDFNHFPSMDLCDLGVQNIVNFKEEMLKIGQKRAIIALQNEQEKNFAFNKKEIEKLKNIIEVYRQMNENGKTLKDGVVVLLIEQENQISLRKNSSFLPKEVPIKSVNFM